MTAFMTPREMFYDYREHADNEHYQYEKLMIEFEEEATKKIGEYAECICEAYLDGCKKAAQVFKKLGLRPIHAYAIQNDFSDFIFEYDAKEASEPDYDE